MPKFADPRYSNVLTRTEKPCSTCKIVKPLSAFHKNKYRVDGRQNNCAECLVILRRTTQKKSDLKRKYNLTLKELTDIEIKQNGVCAICKTKTDKPLRIDHCHSTKMVRGLLCDLCNIGLGHFKDNTERLRSAIEYLEKCN
jgi:hypothetical protein